MLTASDIHALTKDTDIQVTNYWESSTSGATLPKVVRMDISFKGEGYPEIWEKLMTNNTEFDVRIWGTRTVTGSGATDNMLKDEYFKLLPQVNKIRVELGLPPVRN